MNENKKTRHEWVKGLEVELKIKCALVVEGARKAFRFCAKDGEDIELVAMNGTDQTGQGFDIEISDRKPFETGTARDRIKKETVAFRFPRIDEWVTFKNVSVSTDRDSYGKRKVKVDSIFQLAYEDDSDAAKGDLSPKPAARRRVRAAT